MTARCPVCWRTVARNPAGRVWRHHDKAGHQCPMGGQQLPDDEEERGCA